MTVTVAPRRAAADHHDLTLVAAIAGGDGRALATLYDKYAAPCYALARRITADDGLAAEVVQDTFLNLWRNPDRYDATRGRFGGWLLAVAHHRAVDAVRREQQHRGRRGSIDLLDQVADAGGSVADQVEVRERAARALAALGSLPVPQREAVVLAYYGGYTQREIAGLLDIPLGTVKTRTAAALARLRRDLSTSDEGDR